MGKENPMIKKGAQRHLKKITRITNVGGYGRVTRLPGALWKLYKIPKWTGYLRQKTVYQGGTTREYS